MFNPLVQYGDLAGMDSMAASGAMAGLFAMIMGMMVFFVVIAIALYIYMGLTVMKTAKRLNVEPAWLAWIPIANLYLILKMGKQPSWTMLLLLSGLIPYIGIIGSIAFMVFMILAMWKICEARQRPGWWAIITIVPVVGGIWSLIMWGILAWGK